MLAKAREMLVVAALAVSALALAPVRTARGQAQPLPAAVPVLQPPRVVEPGVLAPPAPPAPGTPAPLSSPPPGATYPAPVPPPPLPPPPLEAPLDPGRNGWGPYDLPSPPPSYFFTTEVDILKPTLRNRLNTFLPLSNGQTTFLTVPSASLNWTAAPRFVLGYRLPDSLGLFALSYRFFFADGHEALPSNLDGNFLVRTRLQLNQVDLDYGTTPYSFAPRWDWSWRVGIRAAQVYFDTRLQNSLMSQMTSNNFYGAGPHARLDLYRHLAVLPGLSLFGRLDGAVVIGQIRQNFNEDFNAGGSPIAGNFVQRKTQSVQVLMVQAGLGYTPPSRQNLHFWAGYQFEGWWYLGQIDQAQNAPTVDFSKGELTTNGVFLRARVDF